MEDLYRELRESAQAVHTGAPTEAASSPIPENVQERVSMNAPPKELPPEIRDHPYAQLSKEELIKLYEDMLANPKKYESAHETPDGKPIIDKEGGAVIQPEAGFVVKTKDEGGHKVFLNMTSHELVDPMEEKDLPDQDQPGFRIPLSLGSMREDFDKKGEPCRVVDIIWNPDSVKKCHKDMLFRQAMVELAFGYMREKFQMVLSMRYTVPKMKYKGETIQFQRIRAKKGPKIETMKTQTLSEEEQQSLERDGLADIKKEPVVACPNWKLFCAQRDIEEKLVDEDWLASFEDVFEMTGEKEDQIEEFDGLNNDFTTFVLTAKLDLLMRGFSISIVTMDKKLNISVQGMYKLNLNLPLDFDVANS